MSPRPLIIKLPYASRPFRNPQTGEESELFYPAVSVYLIGNHRVGRPIEALVDSGSDLNLFPADYAFAYFGFNRRMLEKGQARSVLGIGNKELGSFGHKVSLKILGTDCQFNTIVYFSQGHESIPLLGRGGFFDRFRTIRFDEQAQEIELQPL